MYSLSNYYTALPLGSVCSEVVVDVVVEHVILHQVVIMKWRWAHQRGPEENLLTCSTSTRYLALSVYLVFKEMPSAAG